MSRAALIIGSPDDKIKGVYDDMRNYRRFFESESGGAWYPHEITTLENPTSGRVRECLAALKKVNYSVVVFAGHGYYSAPRRCTMVELNKSESMEEHELKVGAPKHSLIIDACRVVTIDLVKKAMDSAFVVRASASNLASSRQAFDRAVQACPQGLATMYGCAINETAGDIPGSGGRYSSNLLGGADSWAKSTHTGILSVSDAHERAIPGTVKDSGGRQNPVGEFSRTLPRFPFGVKA